MATEIYTGTYKVIRFFRKSTRREILARGLTREEAIRIVDTFVPTSNSFVGFDKQFTAAKYFKNIE